MAQALGTARRVAAYDAALHAVRTYFRDQGVREVLTPIRLAAVALEPYIEPLPVPGGYLQTSPELPMKGLLAAGSGSIFQVAAVHRQAERGALHQEGFHLVEWYRVEADPTEVMGDVEQLVRAVFEGVAEALGGEPRRLPAWQTRSFCDLVEETTGVALRGDEGPEALRDRVRSRWPRGWVDPPSTPAGPVATLAAWTSFFTEWSDRALDPWLAARPEIGLHLRDFPAALAALARIEGPTARRFESHVGGVELVNGYLELRDADEQRQRFEVVAQLREALGLPALPVPEVFLRQLVSPGLPACAGAALGLERLIMLAAGQPTLADIAL